MARPEPARSFSSQNPKTQHPKSLHDLNPHTAIRALSKRLGTPSQTLERMASRHDVACEFLSELASLAENGGETEAAPDIVAVPVSMLRLRAVLTRVGVSRSTFFRLVASGDFPRPVSLSARTRAWPSSVVEAWIAQRSERGAA